MANGIYALAFESGYVPEQTRLLRSKIRPNGKIARALPREYATSMLPPEIMEDLPPRLVEDIEDEFVTKGKNPELAQKLKQEWIDGLKKGELNPFTTPTTVLWRRSEEERTSGEWPEEAVLQHENLHHFYNQASSLRKNIERLPLYGPIEEIQIPKEDLATATGWRRSTAKLNRLLLYAEIRNLVPGHNAEEALLRRQDINNQDDPDLQKELLWQAYAVTSYPILTDDILNDPVKFRETAQFLYDIEGKYYDEFKDVTKEKAVASIMQVAEETAHILRRYESGFPRLIEIMNKYGVKKFAEGGLVGNNLKKTSGKGLSSLVEASPDYELSPIGLGSMTQQAQKLAEYGRNGDVYIVHAAEGETVIPMEILDANPQLKALLYGQIEEMGLDPNEFVVGNELNSINPATGLPEFFFKKLFRGVKNAVKKVVGLAKKIAPIALPIAAQAFGIPGLSSIPGVGQYFGAGSIGAAALGGGLGSLIGGQDPLKGALLSGAASGVLGGGLTSDIPFSQAASNFRSAPDSFDYLKRAIAPRFLGPGQTLSETATSTGTNILPPIQASKKAAPDLSGTSIGEAAGDGEGFTIGKFLKNNWGKIGLGLGAAYLAGAFDTAEQPQLADLVGPNLDEPIKPPQHYDPTWPVWQHSGEVLAADGGFLEEFPRRELLVEGPGTEKSDDIPAMLSDGEFVWNSAAVRGADPTGNNNRYAGASALYDMMRKFEMKGQQQPAQVFV